MLSPQTVHSNCAWSPCHLWEGSGAGFRVQMVIYRVSLKGLYGRVRLRGLYSRVSLQGFGGQSGGTIDSVTVQVGQSQTMINHKPPTVQVLRLGISMSPSTMQCQHPPALSWSQKRFRDAIQYAYHSLHNNYQYHHPHQPYVHTKGARFLESWVT